MQDVIDKMQEVVNEMIKMPVPVAIGYYDTSYHLKIINDLEIIIAVDKNMSESKDFSVGVFSDLVAYQNTMNDLFDTLTIVDTILKIER